MTRTPRRMARRVGQLVLAATLTVVIAGCASNAPQDSLKPAGSYARDIDHLFKPVFYVAVVVFVLVEAAIVFVIIKFRRRDHDSDDEFPSQIHGNTRLEIGWTILPAVILALVSFATVPLIFKLNEKPANAMNVTVIGQKYWWAYEYPAQDKFGITKKITTANELHIPAGTKIFLTLKSKDVIHSFWAPRLNGKRDVVPGRIHHWSLEADKAGVYSGQCAEFCGTSHANMRLKVVAHNPSDWDAWVAEMEKPDVKPTSGLAAEGYQLFQQKGCSGCHHVDGEWNEVKPTNPSAPNLTKLFTRDCFAGCIYDLNNRNELEAWLRNPQRKAGSLMVIGQLSEDEIDRLVAYLHTLR